jgi:alanyl-tRNA synthetase
VVEAGGLPPSGVRSRRLPRGLEGAVRLVEIDGVDLNTCGGTHVSRTGEIGMLKIVDTEQLRGGTRVFFLAGRRISTAFDGMLARERALSRLLTCPPSDHLEAVSRAREDSRTASLAVKAMRTELAAHLAGSLAGAGSVGSLHRPEPDMELLRSVADSLRSLHPGAAALLAGGAREGVFILVGPPGLTSEAGQAVARLLDGRGGGPPGLYQGRASRLDRFGKAVALVEVELGRPGACRA